MLAKRCPTTKHITTAAGIVTAVTAVLLQWLVVQRYHCCRAAAAAVVEAILLNVEITVRCKCGEAAQGADVMNKRTRLIAQAVLKPGMRQTKLFLVGECTTDDADLCDQIDNFFIGGHAAAPAC
jgi:hypothetical protein